MHPQDAVKETTPPLKSFAFIHSPPRFKGAAQKGTISATVKGHFLQGIVRDEKVSASHSPSMLAFQQSSACPMCLEMCICLETHRAGSTISWILSTFLNSDGF